MTLATRLSSARIGITSLTAVVLLTGCGESAMQNATDNALKASENATIAYDQELIAENAATPRALQDTRKLLNNMQSYGLSDSEQTAQIKTALLAVVGVCPACAQLLQDESP